jgi:hypothetical protein
MDREIGTLWKAVRDSIGQAAIEYNQRTNGTYFTLYPSGCTSKSSLCMRIEMKGESARSIEVFIEDSEPILKVYMRRSKETREICRYRLCEDRSRLEFYKEGTDGIDTILTPEHVCEMALSDFLFKPFPLAR